LSLVIEVLREEGMHLTRAAVQKYRSNPDQQILFCRRGNFFLKYQGADGAMDDAGAGVA